MVLKNILKNLYLTIFTVDKTTIKDCKSPNTRNKHIKYRLLIFLLFIPILYILIFGYIQEALTVYNVFRTILFILFFRLIAKELTDYLIVIFFYKSSYKFTLKDIRLRKLKKINRN